MTVFEKLEIPQHLRHRAEDAPLRIFMNAMIEMVSVKASCLSTAHANGWVVVVAINKNRNFIV